MKKEEEEGVPEEEEEEAEAGSDLPGEYNADTANNEFAS